MLSFFCHQAKYLVGFATLRELITKCPAKKQIWMQLLLELTTREKEQVRERFPRPFHSFIIS